MIRTLERRRAPRSMAVALAGTLAAAAVGVVALPGVALAATHPGTSDTTVAFTVPDQVVVGESIVVSGTGWKNTAGTAGSVVAVKLDDGGVLTTGQVTNPANGAVQANKSILAIVAASADGSWTATVPYPTAANSTGAESWAAGQTHNVRFLTGSLLTGDKIRTEAAEFTLVAPSDPTDPTDPTDPGGTTSGSIAVTAVVPEGDPGGPGEDGPLSLTVPAGAAVALSRVGDATDRLAFTGQLPPVTVTDERSDTSAAGGGWSVSAQSSEFSSPAGSFAASYLGWTPSVAATRDGLVPGPAVAGSLDGGPGLATSAVLASAANAGRSGSAELGAALELGIPVDTPAGSYAATLTVSLFPTD